MAWGTPVDIGSASDPGGDNVVALNTSVDAPAGSKVFVVIAYFQSGETLSGVSDDGPGLTWSIDHQSNTTLGTGVAIVSADVTADMPVGTVITASFSGTINFTSYIGAMYATGGEVGGTPYGAVHQEQSGTSWSSTGITVASGDLLIGLSHWEDSVVATSTPSGGNSEVHDINAGGGSSMTSVYQVGTGASIAAQGAWNQSAANLNSAAVAYPVAAGGGGTAQKVGPTADSVDGAWLNEAASNVNLYASVDEATASDTDYIVSESAPSSSAVRLKLDPTLGDPLSSTGHILHWRVGKDATGGHQINVTIDLYQGGGDVQGAGTLIATRSHTNVDALTTYDETLTGTEADAITDYGDLYVEITANQV